MNRLSKQVGFTLVELMLAMGFLSALMVIISMTVIQLGNTYNKGITLKEVNIAGKALTSEFQSSIVEVSAFSVAVNAESYVVQKNALGVTVGGRLCTGKYSYIWNYGRYIENGSFVNKYTGTIPAGTQPIHLVKISDVNKTYCVNTFGVYQMIPISSAVELINTDSSQLDLAIHDFGIESKASASDTTTGERLYRIYFTIGTNKNSAITTDATSGKLICIPPGVANSDFNFCSVSDFDLVTRAGNKIK